MSDYDQSRYNRDFPQSNVEGVGNAGLFWLLIAVAALGLLVFIGMAGNGPTTAEHPGGAGAEPVVIPVDPASTAPEAAGTGTIVE